MGGWVRHVVRLVVSAFVLMVVSWVAPGFSSLGFVSALIAAVVITVAGYIIEALLGEGISPYGRGVVGFLTSAIVIYIAQFVTPGMEISIVGALIAAFVIGLIDMFVPTTLR
ncbi:MAG: phage holin family protein [Bacillota bacterium]